MVTMSDAIGLARQVKEDLTCLADEEVKILIDLGLKDLYDRANTFLINAGVQE